MVEERKKQMRINKINKKIPASLTALIILILSFALTVSAAEDKKYANSAETDIVDSFEIKSSDVSKEGSEETVTSGEASDEAIVTDGTADRKVTPGEASDEAIVTDGTADRKVTSGEASDGAIVTDGTADRKVTSGEASDEAIVTDGTADEEVLSGEAASKGTKVPDGKTKDEIISGRTAEGWEYELLDNSDGTIPELESREYFVLKAYKGGNTKINVPATITINITNEAGEVEQKSCPALLRGGKKNKTVIPVTVTSVDFTRNPAVTPDLSYLFAGCKNLTDVYMGNLDTSKVTDMSYFFQGCTSLKNVPGIHKNNFSCVKNMEGMFKGCAAIEWLAITDTYLGTYDCEPDNVSSMFEGCKNLFHLSISKLSFANIKKNTSKNLFSGDKALETIWGPHNIPTDFNIPMPGAYSVYDKNLARSGDPNTDILAPKGRSDKYSLIRLNITNQEEGPEEGPEEEVHVDFVNLNMGYKVFEHGSGKVGEELLVADVFPRNATCKTVLWSSTDPRVVKVTPQDDDSCLITTKGPGFADVVVTTLDGGHSARCNVTVKKYTNYIEESTGDENTAGGGTVNYELVAGQDYDLYEYLESIYAFAPKENKCTTNFSLNSTNPSAVTVGSSGMLSAKGAGFAFLAISYKDHKKPMQRTLMGTKIRVYEPEIMNKTVYLSYAGQTFSAVDNLVKNEWAIYPSSFNSTNKKVATVDESGTVTAVGQGTTKIQITWTNSQNSSATYSFNVKVKKPKLSKEKLELVTGQTAKLKINNVSKDTPVVWMLENNGSTGRNVTDYEYNSGDVVSLQPDKKGTSCVVVGELPGDVFVSAVVNGVSYSCYVEVLRPELTLEGNKMKVKNTNLPDTAFRYISLDPNLLCIERNTGKLRPGLVYPDIDDGEVVIQTSYMSDEGRTMIFMNLRLLAYMIDDKEYVKVVK